MIHMNHLAVSLFLAEIKMGDERLLLGFRRNA